MFLINIRKTFLAVRSIPPKPAALQSVEEMCAQRPDIHRLQPKRMLLYQAEPGEATHVQTVPPHTGSYKSGKIDK